MKKITVLLLAVFVGLTTLSSAQKQFSGVIKSSYKIEGTDDPNILSQIPSEVETIVLGNKSKTVANFEGGASTIIMDGDKKTQTIIFELNGLGKYFIVVDEEKVKEKLKNTDLKYDYKDEYMTIAGYKCQKVIITAIDLETDEEQMATAYVNKDINSTDAHNFAQYPGLMGYTFRVESPIGEGYENAVQIVEIKEINTAKKIKDIDFLLPSDAKDLFKDTTPEEKMMFGITDDDE